MTDEPLYGAFRVSEGRPAVPSERRFCSQCGAAVWIDRNMLAFTESAIILCTQCLTERIKQAKAEDEPIELKVHDKQISGLLNYLRRN